ncbi:MAG: hypothetical protein MUO77_08305 [Anaerolineales bacterium]|nr:hypothetical protein [Anaerolineales bacterium]
MKKQKRLLYGLLATPVLICGLYVCFQTFNDPMFFHDTFVGGSPQLNPLDNPPWSHMGYYQIDPSTILADIKNGRKDVFRFFEDKPDTPEYPDGSFPWSSQEYLTIAKALHLYLTGEPADGEWKIYSPGDFSIHQCRDDMKGFDSAKVFFYKKEPVSFPVTYMEFDPLEELIYATNAEYPREDRQSPLARFFGDPDSYFKEAKAIQGEISAEDALQIAENAGGKEMRQKISNIGCRILVAYFVDKWGVWYYWQTKDLKFTFHFDINSDDGSYKIERDLDRCERAICP